MMPSTLLPRQACGNSQKKCVRLCHLVCAFNSLTASILGYLFAVVQSLFLRLEQREFYLYDVAAAAAAREGKGRGAKSNGHANRGFVKVWEFIHALW